MLTSKITKTWSESNNRWLYQRKVAYLDEDKNLQSVLLLGWSAEEADSKTLILEAALKTES